MKGTIHLLLPFLFPLLLLLLSLFSHSSSSGWTVTELPGYPGKLPFTLETGYVSVGEVEFFYYFVESQSKPRSDPLLFYMNGGPGCSGLNGFLYQIGPLRFNITDYDGGLPTLLYEPNTWTKTANIIFIDAPVGAGFSYATSASAYSSSDTLTTVQLHTFLLNWIGDHPIFQTNPLFIGSDSYAGIITPMLVEAIMEGNEDGLIPYLHITGYVLSCPHTDTTLETNAKIPYAHRMALISDALYEEAKTSCDDDYANPTTAACEEDLTAIDLCIELINKQMIIEPNCAFLSPESNKALQLAASKQEKRRRSLQQFNEDFILSLPRPSDYWCKNFDYLLSDVWGSYPSVQDALHVRPGTVSEFYRCNITLEYTVDVDDVLQYHKNLTRSGLQVLIFSGDHDMVIPHNGIEKWIASFNLSVDSHWRPWFTDGQVAGYTKKYANYGYRLTYATVKGAGHPPMEFKREWCYDMFQRWSHHYPLYIGVGDMDEVQLFYYFVQSERNPYIDPLVLWLTGGPGCSGFSPIAYEIGPLTFDYDSFNGSLPTLRPAEYSWTKVANIIFLDQPVGAGFSYSTTTEGKYSNDVKSAYDTNTFLRKWLLKHPQFLGNQLYIGGDSYSGITVPLVVEHILRGISNGVRPKMELQGYLLGNPVTDDYLDPNSRIPYVHRVNLISDEYYQEAKLYCGGDYVNIDPNNTLCLTTMQKIKLCLLQINLCQILEPQFAFASRRSAEELDFDYRVQEAGGRERFLSSDELPELPCRGTTGDWVRCSKNFSTYTEETTSRVVYHENFAETGLRALIYSGDHDISVPYILTLGWIKSLGLPVFDLWRPWYVAGQVAGYQVKFMNDHFRLTYVTLKGAGHTAPEYKHKASLEMFDRFVARYPI